MVKQRLLLILLFALLFLSMLNFEVVEVSAAPTSDSLAYLINDIASQIQEWNASAYHIGTSDIAIIFGYNDTSCFDLEITRHANLQEWEEVFLIKRVSEHAGYSSSTIDEKTKWALGNISMFASYSLPNSTEGYFNCWRRHLLQGYRYAQELIYEIDRWNATDAFLGLKNVRDSEGHPCFKYDVDAGTGETALRWLEAGLSMDTFFALYELGVDDALAYAVAEWEWLNDNRWDEDHFNYTATVNYEWSLSDVAPNVAKLHLYGEALENYSRIIRHIESAYWNESYSSPLWHTTEKVIQHADSNPERRLFATVNAYTYSHVFYSLMDSGNRTNFENMLEGNGVTQLWQALNSSDLRNATGYQFRGSSGSAYTDFSTVVALLGFFLSGVSPKSGAGLAIPIEADRKHAITGALNSRHFGFDYTSHSIKIPVWANSTLKFMFGSAYPNYTFPDSGVYNVTFSSDWNTISLVTRVSGLYVNIKYFQAPSYYDYNFYGLYSEATGQLKTASERAVTVTCYFSGGRATETFQVNGSYLFTVNHIPLYFHFELGSADREYWVGPDETAATIYIFNDTFTAYNIQFLDLAGALDDYPYVTAERYINGSLMVVEKRKVDAENKILMSLINGVKYTFKIRNGASYTFGEVLMTSETTLELTLKDILFPTEILLTSMYIRIYATRALGTPNGNITITYQDTLNMTVTVTIYVNYKNGTNAYNATETISVFSHVWSSALNDTDYALVVDYDHSRYGSQSWKQYFPRSFSEAPWGLDFLGTSLPFATSTILPTIIIIFVAGCFSALNAEVGAFMTVITAGVLAYLGWISIAVATLVTGFVLAILMAIIYAKRRVITT